MNNTFTTSRILYLTTYTEAALSSDHNPVFLDTSDWQGSITKNFNSKINWKKFKEQINKINRTPPTLTNTEALQEEINKITTEIRNIISQNTTYSESNSYTTKTTKEIKNLIKTKNKKLKEARLTHNPADYLAAKNLSKQIQNKLDELRNEEWNAALNQINEEEKEDHIAIWKLLNKILKKSNSNHPIHGIRGLVYTNPEKTEAIADTLEELLNIQ